MSGREFSLELSWVEMGWFELSSVEEFGWVDMWGVEMSGGEFSWELSGVELGWDQLRSVEEFGRVDVGSVEMIEGEFSWDWVGLRWVDLSWAHLSWVELNWVERSWVQLGSWVELGYMNEKSTPWVCCSYGFLNVPFNSTSCFYIIFIFIYSYPLCKFIINYRPEYDSRIVPPSEGRGWLGLAFWFYFFLISTATVVYTSLGEPVDSCLVFGLHGDSWFCLYIAGGRL